MVQDGADRIVVVVVAVVAMDVVVVVLAFVYKLVELRVPAGSSAAQQWVAQFPFDKE